MWTRSPVQVQCMRQGAQGWCTGMTPEGCDGEGGGRGVQDDEHMSTHGWFMSMYGKNHYNIVVVFTIHWHESAMGVHVSPILNPLPSPSHHSALSQCTGFECPVSCIKIGLVIYFTFGNTQVSMLFSQIIPHSPSPTESKSLFFTSVSLLLSHIQSHCYHLSKFHIYVLIYCTGAFFSDLLHSV